MLARFPTAVGRSMIVSVAPAPLASEPTLQVSVLPTLLHVPDEALAETKTVPAGVLTSKAVMLAVAGP